MIFGIVYFVCMFFYIVTIRVIDKSTQIDGSSFEMIYIIGGLFAPLSLAVLILWFSTGKIADYVSNVLGKFQRKQLEKEKQLKTLSEDKDKVIVSLNDQLIQARHR